MRKNAQPYSGKVSTSTGISTVPVDINLVNSYVAIKTMNMTKVASRQE